MKRAGSALLAASMAAACACAFTASCSHASDAAPCTPGGDGKYVDEAYDDLASYCMVSIAKGQIAKSSSAVVEYDLNTPLFSDYAIKIRTVWMPPGASATYRADGIFDFPKGTIFTKSFGFPKDFRDPASHVTWVETRVFLRGESAWQAVSYQWDEAQSRATKKPGGAIVPVDFIDAQGNAKHSDYLLPNINQCPKCHGDDGATVPIGPRAAELNRDRVVDGGAINQLAQWSQSGMLAGAPASGDAPRLPVWDDPQSGSVETRARSYLDGNCSYCHSPRGEARTTGLFLSFAETDATQLGVCKQPVAAGRASSNLLFDVVPGKPDESIVVYRMQATEPSVAMPELGRSVVHAEAVALVREWITGLSGSCPAP